MRNLIIITYYKQKLETKNFLKICKIERYGKTEVREFEAGGGLQEMKNVNYLTLPLIAKTYFMIVANFFGIFSALLPSSHFLIGQLFQYGQIIYSSIKTLVF